MRLRKEWNRKGLGSEDETWHCCAEDALGLTSPVIAVT